MMQDDCISILYIDDDRDEGISAFFEQTYNDGKRYKYSEMTFEAQNGYESLINSSQVKSANLIIIDSRLFENSDVGAKGKFSGEEFKLILLTRLPFIEVIVISQNGEDSALGVVSKYRHTNVEDENEYYNRELKPKVEEALVRIRNYRNIMTKLESNEEISRELINRTTDYMNGIDDYKDFTKEDVDRLIKAFKEVK